MWRRRKKRRRQRGGAGAEAGGGSRDYLDTRPKNTVAGRHPPARTQTSSGPRKVVVEEIKDGSMTY